MGKAKPAYYYERKATEAKARENYYRTRAPRPRAGTTVTQKNLETFVYRSLFLKFTTGANDATGTDHIPFKVSVGQGSLGKLGGGVAAAAKVGLLTTGSPGALGELARPIRGSHIHPSMIRWSHGTATPVLRTTQYNTTWVQYYDNAAGEAQSNFSVPISKATGDFFPQDIVTTFKTIFSDAAKAGLIGAKNGRAELDLEYSGSFFSTDT
jgi:hypothetical protein